MFAYVYTRASSLVLRPDKHKVPLTILRLIKTALWPPCEEVKVQQRVQLDVIEIHFVIRPSVHL